MEKLFLPSQITYLMPSDLYKVAINLFAFQKDGEVSYSKKNSEYWHIDQAICDQCIQTLIDIKLIEFREVSGGVYKFKIIEPTIAAIKQIPLTEIPNKPLLRLSDEIKWKNQTATRELSNTEILDEIRRLQAQLKRNVTSDLPF